MSKFAVFEFIAHTLALFLLLSLVFIWYWVVGIHKETLAGLPTNPANNP